MNNHKDLIVNLFNDKFNLQRFIDFTQEIFKGKAKYSRSLEFSPKVKGEFNSVVKSFLNLGRYTDNNRKSMILAVIELKREDSIARSRTIQRNFVKDYFLKSGADSALVAFYNKQSEDWRLSFIKLDYSYKNSKLEEDITPAKRFSFLLGKNEKHHTAVEKFMSLILQDKEAPTIDEIEEAFNIEVVTKEFFEKYCDLYLKIKKELDKQEGFLVVAEDADIKSDEFAKKLMGQLVFLYFLQKKGWLGVKVNPEKISKEAADKLLDNKTYECNEVFDEIYYLSGDNYIRDDKKIVELSEEEINSLNNIFINTEYDGKWGSGDKAFIRSMFKEAASCGKSFFKDYLEPIFYNALNDKRGGSTYFKDLNCKIPFLNGGLFQPINENYDYKNADFTIDNSLFSNKNKNKQGEIGDGVLDIFDRYAFTIKEDEPLEKEVAVDPEMLGKVFENLLDVTDRKKKGAFYTPREIVHYMCQESLINYLITEINLNYDEAEALIRYGDIINDIDLNINVLSDGEFKMPNNIRYQAKKIDNALENVKIADPAVGSGAFPLGMVNEIVRARMNLTYYIMNDLDAVFRNTRKIKGRTPYDLKLKTIRRCIHAVDIERSAVDITKLRLWLSLVVEENDFSNIRALPNLDYNIMVGNSLIEEFEGVKLFNENAIKMKKFNKEKEEIREQLALQIPIKGNENLLEVICELENKLKSASSTIDARKIEYELEQAKKSFNEIAASSVIKRESDYILDEIYKLQEEFFEANGLETKVKLKNSIDSLEWLLIEKAVKENGNEKLLTKIKEFKRTNTKPYFLWKLNFARVFRERKGFDIVISNPPYIKIQNLTNDEGKTLKKNYESAIGKFDVYVLFIEKAFSLINESGIVSYIHPHRLLNADYGKGIRRFLLKKKGVKEIVNFGVEQIFETATTYTGIFFYSNNNKHIKVSEATSKILLNKNSLLMEYDDLSEEQWVFRSTSESNLLRKLTQQSLNMSDVFNGIYQGVITVGDDIFVLEGKIENNIFKGYSKALDSDVIIEAELMKKLLKGEHIKRYKQPNSNYYIFYPHTMENGKTKPIKENILINDYPLGYKYINNFREELKIKKIKYKTNPEYWYSLHRAREKYIFESKKILTPQLQNYPNFCIDNEKCYPDAGGYSLIKKENNIDINALLGIMNSSILWYFIKNTSTPFNNNYYYFKTQYLDKFTFPSCLESNDKVKKIAELVKQVLNNATSKEVSVLEDKIDYLVYEIYMLTKEEIEMVENTKRSVRKLNE